MPNAPQKTTNLDSLLQSSVAGVRLEVTAHVLVGTLAGADDAPDYWELVDRFPHCPPAVLLAIEESETIPAPTLRAILADPAAGRTILRKADDPPDKSEPGSAKDYPGDHEL